MTVDGRMEWADRDESARRQAAEWLIELQAQEVSEETTVQWQQWLSADPGHRKAFDQLQGLQEMIERVEPLPWPSTTELAEDNYDGSTPIADWKNRDRKRARWQLSRKSVRWAAAASLGAIALAGLAAYDHFDRPTLNAMPRTVLETAVGELRRVKLADGSILTLDGGSRLTFQLQQRLRDIELDRGQAYFEVAKDASRPFVVHADTVSVTAVGTAFDVREAGADVTIAVADGTVQVQRQRATQSQPDAGSTASLEPPQRITVGQQIRLSAHQPDLLQWVAAGTVATWRTGHRQYVAEPLVDVVADLNRHSLIKIEVADSASANLTVTGDVFDNDMRNWLRSLESALPVIVNENVGGPIVIHARP